MDNVHEEIAENRGEKIGQTAETAGAEESKIAATGLGKFKSVDALLNAYTSLEAEFTRRSQRLKELEEGNKAQSAAEKPSLNADSGELLKAALSDDGVKRAIVGEYLKEVSQNKGIPVILGGVSTPAPKNSPTTVKQAGELLERFLKN